MSGVLEELTCVVKDEEVGPSMVLVRSAQVVPHCTVLY